MTPLPHDYVERVYAGVLGKIIGVYLGRPFEGWSYDRIMAELGDITYYVHEKRGVPLIVTDDDISGTFTFVRALADYGNARDLTPAQIGQTWLNYLIEERTILWWGGLGVSTEHTAYLRLKHGIEAPQSGSIALNGQVVAEQIGAQIFIDGWAMVAPGDPAFAADLARRAASVSHDGEAVYGAQVLAAMESAAFVEPDLDRLLDVGVSVIPADSLIARMITELRDLRVREPDWRKAREWLAESYGYHKYGGGCHMIPNHGLILLSLLYGDDDFQKTLMIVNTSGWDTDCNSGNVGCLMGIKNGLAGLDTGPDYRGPVADRLYLPAADGGRAVSDAVIETYALVNSGRALAGQPPLAPKDGARFHFDLPGAVQGFLSEDASLLRVENVHGHSLTGTHCLALHYHGVAHGRPARAATATFLSPEAAKMPGYGLLCSPTLYPGQTVRARVVADPANVAPVAAALYARAYGANDALEIARSPQVTFMPGDAHEFVWTLAGSGAEPIAEVGVEISSDKRADGTLYLDYLTWDGTPDVTFARSSHNGTLWARAWLNGADRFDAWDRLRVTQNEGVGLVMQGTREWADYRVAADITPHLVKSGGIAARVQGMRRYYALLLCKPAACATGGKLRLVKALDGVTVLAEADFPWTFDETHDLSLTVTGARIQAAVDGQSYFDVTDTAHPLLAGAVALICEEGRLESATVTVKPA
ncbi:MAG TPA: ADP-ribosylglycohydrolase family protein [Anaerolineae bacterium]|nr:ADP-ribosylglycohydrolase family protein [Anaerolineae bacterium]